MRVIPLIDAYSSIEAEIVRCSGHDILLPTGTRFIGHLKTDQPLRFFHKIYCPSSAATPDKVFSHLGFSPPAAYQAFLSCCGGVSLFDQTIHLYGYDSVIGRSVIIDEQRPLYIGTAQRDFASENHALSNDLWRAIGSIVVFNRVWIIINPQGTIRLIRDGGWREFPSFNHAIFTIISMFSTTMACGPVPEVGDSELENSLFCSGQQ